MQKILRAHPEIVADAVQNLKDPFLKSGGAPSPGAEREFFIDNLLVLVHFIIEMIWWTGLATLEFEFPFRGSLISTFLLLSLFLLSAVSQRRYMFLTSVFYSRTTTRAFAPGCIRVGAG